MCKHVRMLVKAPEGWTRHFARRVLQERGAVVLPALAAWIASQAPNPPNEANLLEKVEVEVDVDVRRPVVVVVRLADPRPDQRPVDRPIDPGVGEEAYRHTGAR